MLKAAAETTYINDILPDGKGTVLISLGDTQGLFWYKNGKLLEYPNVKFYYVSPQQKKLIFFYGTHQVRPYIMNLATMAVQRLPGKLDHGWLVYTVGLSFSPSENQLLYEDWEQGTLGIYDLESQKEAYRLQEKGHDLIEGSWSPGGKIIAYLKQDKKEPPIDLGGDGRAGMGHQLAVYDLEKPQVIKEWTGKKLFNSRPIWSPNGEYLLCNMVESLEDNTELKEEPYLINIKTGEVRKITSETYRKRNWALRFLSLLTWIQLS